MTGMGQMSVPDLILLPGGCWIHRECAQHLEEKLCCWICMEDAPASCSSFSEFSFSPFLGASNSMNPSLAADGFKMWEAGRKIQSLSPKPGNVQRISSFASQRSLGVICWVFFTELKVFLPSWKRLQTGLGMVPFFGKSAAGSDFCHRFREQKGWCREIPVPFSRINRLLVPQIPVPSCWQGIHSWPQYTLVQMSSCKASVGAGSEYPGTSLFPSHATGDMFRLFWVNGSCWFHLGLHPFLDFVPDPSCPADVGQVRRSSASSTAFPCWIVQRAMG